MVEHLAATGWIHPGSALFGSTAEVWLVPFVMGIALTTQPHLLVKSLYVSDERAVRKVVAVGLSCFLVYCLVLWVGVYGAIVLPDGIPVDEVMGTYLATAVPWPALGAMASRVNVSVGPWDIYLEPLH